MYSYKRLLVGLDLSEMDETLIAYTANIVKIFEVGKIYFVHVAKSLDLPERLTQKYPDLIAPTDEGIIKAIQDKVDKHFNVDCEYKIEVKEGNAEDKILRWADIKEIDLLIVGRKLELKGKGTLSGKLAKTIHCSVLFVPEGAQNNISKVIVPVDCSKTSALALEEAIKIKKATEAEIIIQHSFEVPSGYHTSGKSYEEFAEIMKSHAYEDVIEFLNKSNVDVEAVNIVLSLDEEDDPAEKAWEVAGEMNADFIIIGSRGRTGVASILMGSVADKMVHYDSKVPLLVVKNKKDNLNFLQALLKL